MSPGSPIIITFPTQDTAPNVQTPLTNQSGSRTPVLRRSRRRLHKRLGRCPPTSPFSPVQIGCGSTGPRRSHTADRRAPASSHAAHAHTRACTSTVAEIRNDSCCAPLLCSDVTLKPAVWNERHPPTSRFPPIKGKTLTLMASQVGGEVRCIRRSDALSSL